MCGENRISEKRIPSRGGSPPRVRGKRTHRGRSIYTRGITPACAGKTAEPVRKRLRFLDHPRVCGENRGYLFEHNGRKGSPPRVRGKQTVGKREAVHRGITPACAGKTEREPHAKAGCLDHPRVCGENPESALRPLLPEGSPPRVRGKHLL